jgi:hypothetical protein
MATLLICLALGCPPRGGHALPVGPPRGGQATEVLKGDPGNVPVWVCIHNHEGAWNDPDDPYWGGLQMDRGFMRAYGLDFIRKYGGWANLWSPRDQMVAAERARKLRGYGPWPVTRHYCGV